MSLLPSRETTLPTIVVLGPAATTTVVLAGVLPLEAVEVFGASATDKVSASSSDLGVSIRPPPTPGSAAWSLVFVPVFVVEDVDWVRCHTGIGDRGVS